MMPPSMFEPTSRMIAACWSPKDFSAPIARIGIGSFPVFWNSRLSARSFVLKVANCSNAECIAPSEVEIVHSRAPMEMRLSARQSALRPNQSQHRAQASRVARGADTTGWQNVAPGAWVRVRETLCNDPLPGEQVDVEHNTSAVAHAEMQADNDLRRPEREEPQRVSG